VSSCTRLVDRVIAVTGAGSGIGAATAARAAAEGATVIVSDIDAAAAGRTAESIRAEGGAAIAHEHDVSERSSWERVLGDAVRETGRLDGLVNNAGITRDRSLLKMTDEDWDAVIDVHLRGTWLGCQTTVPYLREGGGGTIVNLSSDSRHGAFGQANYAAAKAGIIGLTRTVAIEHARHGVRCNAVAPGTVDTPMLNAVDEQLRASWVDSIPLGRFGEAREVAAVIAFLLSDDASYVSGHTLSVDGGANH
jgi:3-oxoacyl-[acyl-carrier protein] reductase